MESKVVVLASYSNGVQSKRLLWAVKGGYYKIEENGMVIQTWGRAKNAVYTYNQISFK